MKRYVKGATFSKHTDYTITLPGYKFEALLEILEEHRDSNPPDVIVDNLIDTVRYAKEAEYSED